MKPWQVLDRASAPDGTLLSLVQHPSEYAILANGEMLMSSRMFASEKALAVLGCAHARSMTNPRVLIGGLGMGFTLRSALDVLPSSALVTVAELVPAVVEWNRTILGALADHPLRDPRVTIQISDVNAVIDANPGSFDAVLIDIDNSPAPLTTFSNVRLYDDRGVAATRASLTAGGVLAVWSAGNDRRYQRQLGDAGFKVERRRVRGAGNRGPRFTILLATAASPRVAATRRVRPTRPTRSSRPFRRSSRRRS
jgi:spermidine synthase